MLLIHHLIVQGNEEFVDTEYAAGSMVWAKMKGYPWWPALVDFCPDTDEYYWLDSWNEEVGTTIYGWSQSIIMCVF